MIINSQGFSHFTNDQNNQDFGIESERMLLILDGCSADEHGKVLYSEVGTRLFAQLFKRREEWDNVEKFEENVKATFDDIIAMMQKYYPKQEEMEEFIMDNLLFTIIACFQTEKEYIVKLFGDGYIITQNNRNAVSYTKFSYGPRPPYFAYKYCKNHAFKDYQFKTFSFEKVLFPKVAIATDGITPIFKQKVKGLDSYKEAVPKQGASSWRYSYQGSSLNIATNKPDAKQMDKRLMEGNMAYLNMLIKGNRQSFSDDVTLAMFGGESK